MTGKPLTDVSGEEIVLSVAPLIFGLVCSAFSFILNFPTESAVAVGTFVGLLSFALFWSRIVDLGFGLKEPRF